MRILRDGALFSLPAATYLLVLMRFRPRTFLKHYPKEIRQIAPAQTEKERLMSILLGLCIGVPLAAALLRRTATLEHRSFGTIFAYAFGVLFIFNLVDLLILDWLIVCWLRPTWLILPGTEHIATPKQYLHHFAGFLTGTVGVALAGFAIAAILSSRSF